MSLIVNGTGLVIGLGAVALILLISFFRARWFKQDTVRYLCDIRSDIRALLKRDEGTRQVVKNTGDTMVHVVQDSSYKTQVKLEQTLNTMRREALEAREAIELLCEHLGVTEIQEIREDKED
jgi:hypothetical protein